MVNNESQEMYLETILRLQQKKRDVHSIDVAEELGYSKPSVSRAVGILKKSGKLDVADDGTLTLTETGLAAAKHVYERHKILTTALVTMGLERKSAEENACRWEHVISEDAFEVIKRHVLEHAEVEE